MVSSFRESRKFIRGGEMAGEMRWRPGGTPPNDFRGLTVQEAAEQILKWLKRKKRDSGEEFLVFEDAPEWVRDRIVFPAHGSMSADDYKYEFIAEALNAISESSDPDEPQFEPDIYYYELAQWLGSNTERFGYVDEAVRDMGHGESISDDIARGQIHEKEEVYQSVLASLRKIVGED